MTMTRGDAHKIVEWLDHHAALGFDDFQVILDGDVDGTADVLQSVASSNVTIHRKPEMGEYYDELTPEERWSRIKAWRTEHEAARRAGEMRGTDPIAWRQQVHFAEMLAPYRDGTAGRGWLALFDVDEFLVQPGSGSIQDLTGEARTPRLRFASFDVDTTGHDPRRPVLEQHSTRWSRDDLDRAGSPWSTRVKSLVRYRKAHLDSTVHQISRGRSEQVPDDVGRLHHFRVPNQSAAQIPYTVDDPVRR